jgi:hypothetical protein
VPEDTANHAKQALERNFRVSLTADLERVWLPEAEELRAVGKIEIPASIGKPLEDAVANNKIRYAEMRDVVGGTPHNELLAGILDSRSKAR